MENDFAFYYVIYNKIYSKFVDIYSCKFTNDRKTMIHMYTCKISNNGTVKNYNNDKFTGKSN